MYLSRFSYAKLLFDRLLLLLLLGGGGGGGGFAASDAAIAAAVGDGDDAPWRLPLMLWLCLRLTALVTPLSSDRQAWKKKPMDWSMMLK